jgi:hypothetical protein
MKSKNKRKPINKYLYKKILVTISREIYLNISTNNKHIPIKKCRKLTHKIIKKKYKIINI